MIDTEDPQADDLFAASEPEMAAGLLKIRQEILANKEIADRIIRKYSIRNTNGYAMHAFLDGATPVEILRRLMVGSEGTLGFVSEAVYKIITCRQKRQWHRAIRPSMQRWSRWQNAWNWDHRPSNCWSLQPSRPVKTVERDAKIWKNPPKERGSPG